VNPCANVGSLPVGERSDRWATPQEEADPYIREFDLKIDACAEDWNTKLPYYISPEMDSLKTDWIEHAHRLGVKPHYWMNPEYINLYEWMSKAWKESQRGCLVVCLVSPNVETPWWHTFVVPILKLIEKFLPTNGLIRFREGRIKFKRHPDDKPVYASGKNKGKPKKDLPTKGNVYVVFLPPHMCFYKGRVFVRK